MRRQLFIDLDGVVCDFDEGYFQAFGERPSISTRGMTGGDTVNWELARKYKDFYLTLPPMPDFRELWAFVEPYDPIILTGVPYSVIEATENKKAWVRRNIGWHVEVRCCLSKEKALHCQSGDVLVDDWEKYKDLWLAAGGTWITHINATSTIRNLKEIGY